MRAWWNGALQNTHVGVAALFEGGPPCFEMFFRKSPGNVVGLQVTYKYQTNVGVGERMLDEIEGMRKGCEQRGLSLIRLFLSPGSFFAQNSDGCGIVQTPGAGGQLSQAVEPAYTLVGQASFNFCLSRCLKTLCLGIAQLLHWLSGLGLAGDPLYKIHSMFCLTA